MPLHIPNVLIRYCLAGQQALNHYARGVPDAVCASTLPPWIAHSHQTPQHMHRCRCGDIQKQGPSFQPSSVTSKSGDSLLCLQAWLVFQCVLRPWLQKLLSLVLAAASFMLVWSEATIGSGRHPDLSPFSHVAPTPPPHPLLNLTFSSSPALLCLPSLPAITLPPPLSPPPPHLHLHLSPTHTRSILPNPKP